MAAEAKDANNATSTAEKWSFLCPSNVYKDISIYLVPIFILLEWFQCGLPIDPLHSDACALLKTACCDRKIGASVVIGPRASLSRRYPSQRRAQLSGLTTRTEERTKDSLPPSEPND